MFLPRVTFLTRFTARLLRALILALACAVRARRIVAASARLLRRVFARVRFLSRLAATPLRAPILVLAFADRALRILAESTRLLRRVLARATELDRTRVLATLVRPWDRALETLRDVLFGTACTLPWPPPFARTVCALGAPFAFFADLISGLSFGAAHAVSASARLPMNVKNTIRFIVSLSLSLSNFD
jgi:hypothetical protein